MVSCTRKIEFDAAHRVIGEGGKCKFLHGHRYALEASFASEELDELGMVVNFGTIKERLGKWIDDNWDHNAILSKDDIDLGEFIEKTTKQKIYYLPYNPTAENMVLYLSKYVIPKLFPETNFYCVKLKLYETVNCYAEITREE